MLSVQKERAMANKVDIEDFKKAREGDKSALIRIYVANKKIIYDCLSKAEGSFLRGVERQVYEDACSDALIRAIIGFDETRGSTFNSWAYPVLKNAIKVVNRNHCTEQGKFERAVEYFEDKTKVTDSDGVEKEIDIRDELIDDPHIHSSAKLNQEIMVEKIKSLLTDRSYDMFQMSAAGYSLEEIGDRFGISKHGADKQLSKDRKYIRDIFANSGAVYRLAQQGKKYPQIATMLGMDIEMVEYYHKMYLHIYFDGQKPLTREEREDRDRRVMLHKLYPLLKGSSRFDVLFSRKILGLSPEETMQRCGIKVAPNYIYRQSERASRTIDNFLKISEVIHTAGNHGEMFDSMARKYKISEDDVVFFYDLYEYLRLDGEAPEIDTRAVFERYGKPTNSNWKIMQIIQEEEVMGDE